MSLIDQVKGHYDSKGFNSIEVPEWGDEDGPLIVYFSPMTIDQQNKLYKLSKDGNTISALVDMLIMKSESKDGKKLFTREDKHQLLHHADPDVITKVIEAVRGDIVTPEEAEGE